MAVAAALIVLELLKLRIVYLLQYSLSRFRIRFLVLCHGLRRGRVVLAAVAGSATHPLNLSTLPLAFFGLRHLLLLTQLPPSTLQAE